MTAYFTDQMGDEFRKAIAEAMKVSLDDKSGKSVEEKPRKGKRRKAVPIQKQNKTKSPK